MNIMINFIIIVTMIIRLGMIRRIGVRIRKKMRRQWSVWGRGEEEKKEEEEDRRRKRRERKNWTKGAARKGVRREE